MKFKNKAYIRSINIAFKDICIQSENQTKSNIASNTSMFAHFLVRFAIKVLYTHIESTSALKIGSKKVLPRPRLNFPEEHTHTHKQTSRTQTLSDCDKCEERTASSCVLVVSCRSNATQICDVSRCRPCDSVYPPAFRNCLANSTVHLHTRLYVLAISSCSSFISQFLHFVH